MERENARLDRRLDELRQAIASKRQNVEDLEVVLRKDYDRLKKLPRWFITLIVLHYIFMMMGWANGQGPTYLFNTIMFFITFRRIYREVPAWVAPLSLFVLSCSIPFGSSGKGVFDAVQ